MRVPVIPGPYPLTTFLDSCFFCKRDLRLGDKSAQEGTDLAISRTGTKEIYLDVFSNAIGSRFWLKSDTNFVELSIYSDGLPARKLTWRWFFKSVLLDPSWEVDMTVILQDYVSGSVNRCKAQLIRYTQNSKLWTKTTSSGNMMRPTRTPQIRYPDYCWLSKGVWGGRICVFFLHQLHYFLSCYSSLAWDNRTWRTITEENTTGSTHSNRYIM